MEIKNKIAEILRFVFELSDDIEVSSLSADNRSDWDSMKQVTIVSALESEFDIFIEVDDAASLMSYEKIVSFVESELE